MHFYKYFLLYVLCFLPMSAVAVEHSELKFNYSSNDGSITLACKHNIKNEGSGDWWVNCANESQSIRKEFSVHFFLRSYQRAAHPQQMLEVLYWLTDRNHLDTRFASHSLRLTQDSLSQLQTLQMDLGVENDYAYLALEYRPQIHGRPQKN